MQEVTVVIPNYNGQRFLEPCLDSLQLNKQDFSVILVDNGSVDGSIELVQKKYPWVQVIALPENTGFTGAVNTGIRKSKTDYVLLLNNDTQVAPDFVEQMLCGIKRHKNCFSAQAQMIQAHDHKKMDDAGNYYNAMGWAFALGKGKTKDNYQREHEIFTSCAGAAIYRRDLLMNLGLFDQEHFAYLEDMDIGYRARIFGYQNYFLPKAVVYHVGSGTSGSTYNEFKIRYSSRNNIYLIYKNMPILQIILNLPFLIAGFGIKILFFTMKGFGREYAAGIKNGFQICKKEKKVRFHLKNTKNYLKIQLELWKNIVKRLIG